MNVGDYLHAFAIGLCGVIGARAGWAIVDRVGAWLRAVWYWRDVL